MKSQSKEAARHERFSSWRKAFLWFLGGLLGGPVCVLGIHGVVFGNWDPLVHSWPRLLEFTSFVLAGLVALRTVYAIASVFGLYAGLVAFMLLTGEAEYPIASMIGLAIRGFAPAVAGIIVGTTVRFLARRRLSHNEVIEFEKPASGKHDRVRFNKMNIVLATLIAIPLLYFVSIGIMTPVLRYHGGDTGYRVWQIVYGDPLGHAPKHVRRVVNRYLVYSDRAYWLIREMVKRP